MTDLQESAEENMGRNLKIILIVSMLIVTTFFCFLPKILLYYASKKEATEMDRHQFRKLRRRRRLRKVLLSLTNCFASGVFLGVCLLDVLPEVEENFDNFFEAFPGLNREFPTPQFCVVLGFLILITIEQLANLCKSGGHSPHGHHHENGTESLFSSTASTIPPNRLDYQAIINHQNHHRNQLPEEPVVTPHDEEGENRGLAGSRNRESYGALEEAAVRDRSIEATDDNLDEEIAEAQNIAEDLCEEEIERREVQNDPTAHSQMRYIMLAVALSIHSVFEGLALGLMEKLSSVVQLFTAIAIHKCIVAFSFGINMAQSDLGKCAQMMTMLIFCLASPIGTSTGLGIEMVHFDEGIAGAVIGSLQGLACGSFIYIVFFELLPHEFFTRKRRPNPLLKVLALTFGIGLMCLIMMLSPV